jgi:hypothetical protein
VVFEPRCEGRSISAWAVYPVRDCNHVDVPNRNSYSGFQQSNHCRFHQLATVMPSSARSRSSQARSRRLLGSASPIRPDVSHSLSNELTQRPNMRETPHDLDGWLCPCRVRSSEPD